MSAILAGAAVTALTVAVGLVLTGIGRKRTSCVRAKADVPRSDPFIDGSATERRAHPRRRGNPVDVLVRDAAGGPTQEARVLDRSAGGLCLELHTGAVAVGTFLSVRAAGAPFGTPWTMAEVRRCRRAGDRWLLGCAFLGTPSWNEQLLFG